MTLKDIAYKLEEIWIEAEKVDSLQIAIFQAIYKGEHNPDVYEWAFNALGDRTFSLQASLEKIVDEIFELLRKERHNE